MDVVSWLGLWCVRDLPLQSTLVRCLTSLVVLSLVCRYARNELWEEALPFFTRAVEIEPHVDKWRLIVARSVAWLSLLKRALLSGWLIVVCVSCVAAATAVWARCRPLWSTTRASTNRTRTTSNVRVTPARARC